MQDPHYRRCVQPVQLAPRIEFRYENVLHFFHSHICSKVDKQKNLDKATPENQRLFKLQAVTQPIQMFGELVRMTEGFCDSGNYLWTPSPIDPIALYPSNGDNGENKTSALMMGAMHALREHKNTIA